jgi:hypothetical protein
MKVRARPQILNRSAGEIDAQSAEVNQDDSPDLKLSTQRGLTKLSANLAFTCQLPRFYGVLHGLAAVNRQRAEALHGAS